jgi:hypothetical protein
MLRTTDVRRRRNKHPVATFESYQGPAQRTALAWYRNSVQPKFAVDCANFGRLDQARMRHGDRVQRAFELFQPKVQELI